MKPLLALALILGCATPRTHAVVVPEPIDSIGGLYQPWTAQHEREARSVLACVGADSMGSRPTLWVAPRPLVIRDELIMAFYDPSARAIVFAPIAVQSGAYWLVFRHEVLHHATHRGNDARVFREAERCGFWPVNPARLP